jgi:5,10-methylene-tetrahydrofolate dehydrogenase/methenyl tetrahydrofolate cyclohydrolase
MVSCQLIVFLRPPHTSFYSGTPGGVGPINVAMLLQNVVEAAESKAD